MKNIFRISLIILFFSSMLVFSCEKIEDNELDYEIDTVQKTWSDVGNEIINLENKRSEAVDAIGDMSSGK